MLKRQLRQLPQQQPAIASAHFSLSDDVPVTYLATAETVFLHPSNPKFFLACGALEWLGGSAAPQTPRVFSDAAPPRFFRTWREYVYSHPLYRPIPLWF